MIFLDKYFSRQDFELCYMDTDLFYLTMSDYSLDVIVRPEMKQAYKADKKNWLTTDKFREKTPGLFKPEFVGTRGMWLLQSATLFKMRHSMKISIATKVSYRSIMICIFSAIKMSWMFS